MLIEFKVKNFRSFKDEQVFSMVASSDNSLAENTVETSALSKYKVLTTAAIYGANASGKTTIIKALAFLENFVRNSHKQEIGSKIRIQPFLLDNTSSTLPTEFELTFVHQDIRYQYGFSLDTTQIIEEWLFAYPFGRSQLLFERKSAEQSNGSQDSDYVWNFGSSLKGENRSLAAQTRPNVLFLSKAADSNHKRLSQVYDWFGSCLNVYVDANIPLSVIAIITRDNLPLQQKITDLLSNVGLGVTGFEVVEKDMIDMINEDFFGDFLEDMTEASRNFLIDQKIKTHQINVFHQTTNSDITRSFPLTEESMGTQRLFSLSPMIFRALQEGRVLILDELDSSLHPLLVRAIIKLFHNPEINQKGAQLIFNTHDTTLLDTDLFRRDQVWLVEKDRAGASHLYPLSDFKPREGEALQKRYLQGRYGGTPLIQALV